MSEIRRLSGSQTVPNEIFIDRILLAIQKYERGEGIISDIEKAIELYEPLLEAIPYSTRTELHDLIPKLWERYFGIEGEDSVDVIDCLKQLLGSLR